MTPEQAPPHLLSQKNLRTRPPTVATCARTPSAHPSDSSTPLHPSTENMLHLPDLTPKQTQDLGNPQSHGTMTVLQLPWAGLNIQVHFNMLILSSYDLRPMHCSVVF